MVGVRGRAEDRVNHGRVDPKDLFGWQANHSPDRLTRPLVRRDGRLVETDWDTAMDAVVGVCMLVPAAAAVGKAVGATVMTVAGIRFAVTGVYELTGSAAWKSAAGWTGLVLAVIALYAAVALALEGSLARTVLPVGRNGRAELSGEPGVRPQL